MASTLLLLEGLCGLIYGDGALLVPRWCLVILTICSLQQISTMAKLFPLMKPQILENVVLILAFMISTIPDVTLVGLMVQFGVSLIVF